MAQYPGTLKTFTNPTSADNLNTPPHATQHAEANDEIIAIETELGINPSGSYTTVKARLDALLVISNVLFQYSGVTSNSITIGTGTGEMTGALSQLTGGGYRYLAARGAWNTYVQMYKTKFMKIADINTVTVYAETAGQSSISELETLKVDIGGQSNTVAASATGFSWVSLTVDVSTLTNGTVYDVTVSMQQTGINATTSRYIGNLMGFGS